MNKIILSILLQTTNLVLFSQDLIDTSSIISDTIHEMELNFIDLEKVPTVPECEILGTNKERIECLGNYMQRHVVQNFNYEIFDTFNIPEGRYTISTNFVISEFGIIENIMVKAPNQELKNEAIRVLQLLPALIPKQEKGGKYVRVRYALPITVIVEGNTSTKKKKRKK